MNKFNANVHSSVDKKLNSIPKEEVQSDEIRDSLPTIYIIINKKLKITTKSQTRVVPIGSLATLEGNTLRIKKEYASEHYAISKGSDYGETFPHEMIKETTSHFTIEDVTADYQSCTLSSDSSNIGILLIGSVALGYTSSLMIKEVVKCALAISVAVAVVASELR